MLEVLQWVGGFTIVGVFILLICLFIEFCVNLKKLFSKVKILCEYDRKTFNNILKIEADVRELYYELQKLRLEVDKKGDKKK